MQKIITTVHAYKFFIDDEAAAREYAELKRDLKAKGLKVFCTWGGDSHHLPDLDGVAVELETKHLFNNQWNTAPIEGVSELGRRVFDWAEDCLPHNKKLKRGHWLEQTPEMAEIRRNTDACGYCGKQEPAAKGNVFCQHCLDSEYLTEKDLHLTRMRAVDSEEKRDELTEAERAHLMPLFVEAQTHGNSDRGKARIAATLARVEEKYTKAVTAAENERDGFNWLMAHGYNVSNVIYYSHTDRFCFGWRHPIGGAVLARTLEIVCEFPQRYEIKTEDGRTFENY